MVWIDIRDGDWQSFDHLSQLFKAVLVIKIGIDDWDAEFALLDEFNKLKYFHFDAQLINSESIISSCSQENFLVPNNQITSKTKKQCICCI